MRVVTWNVNSLRARLERVEEWCARSQPDVLCMQETKLADDAFPALTFQSLGYETAHHGQGQWNGVAILSRVGLDDVVANFAPGIEPDPDARIVTATCGGVRISSCYVPNGRALDDPHYQYKLQLARPAARPPRRPTRRRAPTSIVTGDFNIAPEDRDVYDPTKFVGATHVSQPERDAPADARATGVSSTCSASSTPTHRRCTRGGTTAPATSTRAAVCGSTSCSARRRSPSAAPGASSTATRARASRRATTPR